MTTRSITSRDNDNVRHARKVRDGKVIDSIFIEGVRLCEEALRSGIEIRETFHNSPATLGARAQGLLDAIMPLSSSTFEVSDKVMESLSDTKTSQGIVMIGAKPNTGPESLQSALHLEPLIVILHRINNPANAGAILRTAEAAGVNGIIATSGTCDPFMPKALRGAMGATFRLPLWTGAEYEAALSWCKKLNVRTTSTDAQAKLTHTDIDWTQGRAVILGTEARGLSAAEETLADDSVRIPLCEPVESLNVAVAAGVILYEARRQRSLSRK